MAQEAQEAPSGRLAELTIALSLATDLGTGQPMAHGLRTCWLSLRAAEAVGLDAPSRSAVYYVALLRFIGCTSDASDTAVVAGGDEIGFNAAMAPMLMASPGESTRFFMRHLGEGLPLGRRVGRLVQAVTDPGMGARSLSGHCEVGARLAQRLGLPGAVSDALAHAYERWDGKGYPDGWAGEDVPAPVRVVTVARDVELWAREGGWSAVADVLAGRRGRGYDPAVVDVMVDSGPAWLAELGGDTYAQVLDAEPGPPAMLGGSQLDEALEAIADFTDLKSRFFRGHSSGVAELVRAAGRAGGMSEAEADDLGRAALVHDVGTVGIASGLWDHPGALSADQWERVRLHTYLTERVLHRSALLAPFANTAARHHERADGSGYHRAATGDDLAAAARLLAAADAYHAMTEDRAHRPAATPADAAAQLLDEADARRFERREVDAVLEGAGQGGRPPRVARPSGLTEREVDVLRLIARGHTNREVAKTLGVSPKTVGSHVEHIYAKAGVSTRAGATLFAMEHGLLAP